MLGEVTNRLVAVDQLADRVCGEQLPHRAAGTLCGYLSRLRGALSDDSVGIQRRPGGYVLTVDESAVDLHRFRALLARARDTGDDDHAAALFEVAFALWRADVCLTRWKARLGERFPRGRAS